MTTEASAPRAVLDPVLTTIMSNRLDGIVREMTNTLLRSARSAVISSARDFSCGIVTADNQILASAEGLPVHIFGMNVQTAAIARHHPDYADGDAYLDNDPYGGNTHAADHTFMVPVFFEGEHLFTVCAKAHQADIGNGVPSSYNAAARDVYHEGALIFPCVRIQRNRETIQDIVRICRARIRVPDQWYGDFLAGLGAARIGERRLKEFCAKYGRETVRQFIRDWFNYSEQRMIQGVAKLPKGRLTREGQSDPIEGLLPEGLKLKVTIDIDPEAGAIAVDLTDNPDSIDCGLNVSEASAISSVLGGIFNVLDNDIPKNQGSFRRVTVKLRDNCAVGRPAFPHSCSVSTTNIAERLVNVVQSAFAELGDGFGMAEGGTGLGAGMSVISGRDARRDGAPFVNRMMLSTNGGPASPTADGWVNYGFPIISGLMYRDSVEVDEVKLPIHVYALRMAAETAGAGRTRGAPAQEIVYGPVGHPLTIVIPCDGQFAPPRGVHGGHDGEPGVTYLIDHDGTAKRLPNVVTLQVSPGQKIRGVDSSGGGYGDPHERDPARVLHDVAEGWESEARARDLYGVALRRGADGTLAVDDGETARLRWASAKA
ncbi:hydantoinase B/oxoprolinase family protein [Methylopila musalis]|uniref:Hydantoinase B/oxoprolinase family protein n=1 Tax=Methylopila musalis TaxID=1134781 RepID=A0ABW3Z8V7_9HYPH